MDGMGEQQSGFEELLDGIPMWAQVFGGLVVLIFVCIVGLTLVTVVKNWRALRKAGVDPLAVQGELAGKLANSSLLADDKSLEERLRELEDLHGRGVISDEEYRVARQSALADG